MIQGLTYFSGPPGDVLEGRPASAFSKGDLLMLDSTSSISRVNVLLASGVDIIGVAEADSNQSINNLVSYRVPDPNTLWLCSLDTALTSEVTPGVEGDHLFSTANGRTYFATSANSVRMTVVRGTAGPLALSQSVHSQVVVKLIQHAGNFELS